MDMTQPKPTQRLFSQVGCSQCGEQFKALRDSGFSHCRDHQFFQVAVELSAGQVAAMDDTMSYTHPGMAPHVRPVRDYKAVLQAFAGYADAVMARRRADDKRTKAQRIQDALRFDGPAPTMDELLSILAGVHSLVDEVNALHDSLNFSKAGDKIDEAYQAIEDEYAEFQEREAEREASVRLP